ncbi:hypothetical protein SDC9_40611 [bioreactor metagenome]|uniref:PorZ N-terminal beta-propeller domain-containing protein n=1 Tax=bioreactor metagenome TaxID=1076179 RepID=A0A644VT45_9ZZZZ
MRKALHLILFLIILTGSLSAQDVAVGEWRDHLPYSTVTDVAVTPDLIYAATPYSLFYYDVPKWQVERFSTVQGLSDIGISAIEYSASYKTLVISYSNANIDLILPDSSVYNIPDIKRKNIPGNKTINNITVDGRYAWLSCGFGIVIIDLQKKEIKDTYYIGADGAQVNVRDVEFLNDTVFASSDEGIFKASLNSPNLAYFGNWSKMDTPVSDGDFEMIEAFSGKLFACLKLSAYDDDTTYIYENGNWQKFTTYTGVETRGMNVSNGKLLMCGYNFVQIFDAAMNSEGTVYLYNNLVPMPNSAEYTGTGDYLYIGDQNYGLVKTWNIWGTEIIRPAGPFSANAFTIAANGQAISTVTGGYDESWGNLFRHGEVSVFSNGTWSSVYGYVEPGMDSLFDLVSVQTDPSNPGHIFAGSYGKGLVEFLDNQIHEVYNTTNSTISPVSLSPNMIDVAGLKFDSDGNLWITTTGNSRFLTVRKADGQFKTFNLSPYSFSSGTSAVIDQNGYKWIALPRSEGLFVFNDNNTIDITSDDQSRKLTTAEGLGALPSMGVQCVAVDKDNEIWLGTDAGIAVIYNPTNIFEGGDFDAQQILVDVDGYVQPLLESEKVKCIAVDGANRKWIGTEKAGVFLVSEDGTEEIYHFTLSDSPLLSDEINGIAIVPESGEVFFATSKGIISFRGTATEPKTSLDSVLVFPNPVMSDFNGYVSISGLIDNGWVTITDIYGTLIYKTRAMGGQAIWNCLDMSGDRPATGVYLIFVTNDDGSVTKSTKLMFYH